ncbi:APC family permease (plasmid) [Mycolicibacterium psychrotolerans]|uniref:APC family permease n=1 Tax=Mycolicibacterium psychrotolerans TaxID=216929 RepID=UPI003D671416
MTATRLHPGQTNPSPDGLRRVLGVTGLVIFGLAYMDPMAVFDTYGVVSQTTHGHVPTAYLVTFGAMIFTAFSYAVLVRAYPSAGSTYTYARRAFGGAIGFLTGWALMLDYLLLPLINYLLIGIYLNAQFPAVPAWAFCLAGVVVVTTVNIVGIVIMHRTNLALVGLQLAFVLVFLVVAALYTHDHPGTSLLQPLYDQGFDGGDVLGGAAVVSLSFLGFDAVSTMSEDAHHPRRTVPKAIVLTALLGGLIFFSVSYAASLIQPNYQDISDPDSAAHDLVAIAGGPWLQAFFLASYMAACIAAALSAQAGVTRILFAMGRDGVLPRVIFGRISKRFHTPVGATLFVAALSLAALVADLETMASIVSFGALAAFSLVNLSVIKHFLIDQRRRGITAILIYGISPVIAFGLTAWLWLSLSMLAFTVGMGWLLAGFCYLLGLTRWFRRPIPEVSFDETDIAANVSRVS